MVANNKNTKYAVSFTCIGFLFCLTALVAPYWLQNDGVLQNPKFHNIGLWEVCFNNFIEPHYFYDEPFDGCGWVFDDEYVVIHDFLLPPFFVAVQFLFTVCFTLCMISCLLMAAFLLMPNDNDLYIVLLLTKSSLLFLAATCGLISVIVFGARGDGRDWMPHWEHNDMGWAFALAVLGSMIQYPASILFMIEARRMRYKRLNEIGNREAAGAYSMDDRKRQQHHHTDI